MDLVVVGAGVAGLSAAWHAARQRPDLRVTLLEAGLRAGGLIETERTRDGFRLEHGPDSLMRTRAVATHVVRELGLDDEVIAGDGARRSYLLDRDDRLRVLPEGLMTGSPSAAWALVRSPLLSARGKLRFLFEPCVPARRGEDEESVDQFFRRRFGAEMTERIVEPLLRGIYGSPTRELGLLSVMPHLADMERRSGSVARASMGARRSSGSPLVSLKDGMAQLTDALARGCTAEVRTGAAVRAIERRRGSWSLILEDGGTLAAHAVVLAVPAWCAARLLEPLDADLARDLGDIEHAPVTAVHMAWSANEVPHPMDGTGFVVSPDSRRAISACTWSSRKWSARAPEGTVLVRAFLRDASLSEQEAIAMTRDDLRDLMGIDAAPRLTRVRRQARVLPRVGVGHRARVTRMAERAAALPSLALAGNAHGGVGVPACIESGARAAAAALRAIA